MNEHDLKHIIEATLLAAGKPVTTQQLLELFEERERPAPELLTTAIGMLIVDYENRGIELVEVASGWRIQVRPETAQVVSRLWTERPAKYSRAFLETVALIAYRQPITRSEIEEIRGVSISSTIMRTLQERGWIRTVGHREVPGRPELLGTTRDFLDYFGLKSLDQLPTLAELKDLETIGVQLELPADQPQAEGAEGEVVASSEEGAATEETAESGETTEITAQADANADAPDAATTEANVEGDTVAAADATVDAEADDTDDEEDDDLDDEEEDEEEDDDFDDEDDDEDDEDDEDEDEDIALSGADESSDDTELSADAEDGDIDEDDDDEDDDSGASSPPMVASNDDEETDRTRVGEPPSEA